MKYGLLLISLLLAAGASAAPAAYINQNIGFNVKGYKYSQSQFPCEVDKVLVEEIVSRSTREGISIVPVATADKIQNGVIPVIAIDIEQMVLSGDPDHHFGIKTNQQLPKMQVTAAVVKGKEIVTAKHTCAIVTLREFTPSSDVTDLGTPGVTMCTAMRKCIKDLSKDIVDWAEPQLH
jgi:hypothetical protein